LSGTRMIVFRTDGVRNLLTFQTRELFEASRHAVGPFHRLHRSTGRLHCNPCTWPTFHFVDCATGAPSREGIRRYGFSSRLDHPSGLKQRFQSQWFLSGYPRPFRPLRWQLRQQGSLPNHANDRKWPTCCKVAVQVTPGPNAFLRLGFQ